MVFVYLSLTTATPLTTLLVRPLETFYLRLVEWLKLEPVTPKGRVFKSLLIIPPALTSMWTPAVSFFFFTNGLAIL